MVVKETQLRGLAQSVFANFERRWFLLSTFLSSPQSSYDQKTVCSCSGVGVCP
jgi:hypothetical protein